MRILFFGDSITWGGYDTQGGWADRLKRQYQKGFAEQTMPKHQLYDLGIGGETSDGLLKRIETEIVARLQTDTKPAIFVAVGLNDACFVSGSNEVIIDQYAENLKAMAAICKKYADTVYFVGLTPIPSDEATFRRGVLRQVDITQYDERMHQVADEGNVVWIEVLDNLKQSEDIWIHDSIHLNDAGHETVLSLVEPHVSKLLAN